ncbi:MAG: Stk1 family PASTA domain-containing Ser/Thr kinase [Candidatus Nanopelagicaceae bacterium]|nr:Stk1 family PASTA domain-containing Ser/Thr kinase [Candidatus Nanopelagicaceae bacterium]
MSDLRGELIDGRYQIGAVIASGGMATVYSAIDTRLDRPVAVKIMHAHLAQDEDFVARFIREAKAAAAISHPNLISVHDQGWNTGGTPAVFLVMELVSGSTLRDLINQKGRLAPGEVLPILSEVLSALAVAHKAGIVHRDLKPENIMISTEGKIKVGDFGLARAMSAGQTLTADASVLLGTVAYLAPEQVQRGIADARSDVYSLGVVTFEALTGKKPYEGESPIHIAYQHVNERIPAPSTIVTNLPKEVDELVVRATSPDPDLRPANAQELSELVRLAQIAIDPANRQLSLPLGLPPLPVPIKKEPRSKVKKIKEISKKMDTVPVIQNKYSDTGEIRRQTSKRVRRNRIIAIVLFFAFLLSAGATWYNYFGPGAKVSIPSIVGMKSSEAKNTLTQANLNLKITKEIFSEEIGKGRVIEMNPSAGEKIAADGLINVTISKGPERYLVPKLSGLSLADAGALLTKSKLVIGSTNYVFNEKIEKDLIIGSSPTFGEILKKNSPVNLLISKGSDLIDVGAYAGKSSDQALTELNDAGFDVTVKEKFSETVKAGNVISRDPQELKMARGSKITLTVSKGPEYVLVPTGLLKTDQQSATKKLENAGFVVKAVVPSKKITGKVPKVFRVTPLQGSKAKRGSTVLIDLK